MPDTAKTPSPISYERYKELTGFRRCELLGGAIYDLAAPSKLHQAASMLLANKLFAHLSGKPCRPYCAPYDVVFNGEEDADPTLQPDLLVLCKGEALPRIVVEILSFSERKRRSAKMEIYRRFSIPEYWELNPDAGTIALYALEGGQYVRKGGDNGALHSPSIGFELDIEAFYDEVEDYLENS